MVWEKLSFYDSGLPNGSISERLAVAADCSATFVDDDLPFFFNWETKLSSYSDYRVIKTAPVPHEPSGSSAFWRWHVDIFDQTSNVAHWNYYFDTQDDENRSNCRLDYVPFGGVYRGYTLWGDGEGGILMLSDTLLPLFYWPSFTFLGDWNPQYDVIANGDLSFCDKLYPIHMGKMSGWIPGQISDIDPYDILYWMNPYDINRTGGTEGIPSLDQSSYLIKNLIIGHSLGEPVYRLGESQLFWDQPGNGASINFFSSNSSSNNALIVEKAERYLIDGRYYLKIGNRTMLDMGTVEPDLTLSSNGIAGGGDAA